MRSLDMQGAMSNLIYLPSTLCRLSKVCHKLVEIKVEHFFQNIDTVIFMHTHF